MGKKCIPSLKVFHLKLTNNYLETVWKTAEKMKEIEIWERIEVNSFWNQHDFWEIGLKTYATCCLLIYRENYLAEKLNRFNKNKTSKWQQD